MTDYEQPQYDTEETPNPWEILWDAQSTLGSQRAEQFKEQQEQATAQLNKVAQEKWENHPHHYEQFGVTMGDFTGTWEDEPVTFRLVSYEGRDMDGASETSLSIELSISPRPFTDFSTPFEKGSISMNEVKAMRLHLEARESPLQLVGYQIDNIYEYIDAYRGDGSKIAASPRGRLIVDRQDNIEAGQHSFAAKYAARLDWRRVPFSLDAHDFYPEDGESNFEANRDQPGFNIYKMAGKIEDPEVINALAALLEIAEPTEQRPAQFLAIDGNPDSGLVLAPESAPLRSGFYF